MYLNSVSKQKELFSQIFVGYSQELSDKISAQFYERYGDVQAFSKNLVFQQNNVDKMKAVMDEYVTIYGIYDLIIYTDLKGKYIASNTKSSASEVIEVSKLGNNDFSKYEWFNKSIKQEWTSDSQKGYDKTYFSNVQLDELVDLALNKKRMTTAFSTIVYDTKNNPIGVLTARADFKWAENELITVYKNAKAAGFNDTEIQLINNKGDLITEYDPAFNKTELIQHDFDKLNLKFNLAEKNVVAAQELIAGKNGSGPIYHARKKIDQIGAWTKISNNKFIDSIGWGVIVRSNSDDIFGSINKAKNIFLIATILMLVIGGFIYSLFNNKIMKTTERSIKNITDLFSKILDIAHDLKENSRQLSNATSESASSIEETSASLTQISSLAQNTKMDSEKTMKNSQISLELAEKMKLQIDQLKKANITLAENSKKMGSIVETIQDISTQTNLLALNASVEAARAGEHGKGFAVVAEAVRTLANRSMTESQSINYIIQEIVEKVSQSTDVSENINKDYVKIFHQIQDTLGSAQQITQSANEQARGVDQISISINEQDKMTQKNALLSESMNSTSNNLNLSIESLNQSLEEIKHQILGKK